MSPGFSGSHECVRSLGKVLATPSRLDLSPVETHPASA
jgi:hypothetical protein